MKTISFVIILCLFQHAVPAQKLNEQIITIGRGQVPSVVKDKDKNIYIAYGTGDSIMYVSSKDGISFSTPSLVAVLPGLFSFAMRGPQVAVSSQGLIITACSKEGNIYAYTRLAKGRWTGPVRLNQQVASAKEGLMALSAERNIV